MTMDATLAGHLQELRRGTVVVASLMVLREPGYGYSLLETLSGAGFEVEGNTLYPLLRRLGAAGPPNTAGNTAAGPGGEPRRGPPAQVLPHHRAGRRPGRRPAHRVGPAGQGDHRSGHGHRE